MANAGGDRVALRAEEGLLVLGRIVAWLAYAWLVLVDVLLVFRVVLLAFGANPEAQFFKFVVTTTADVMAPFRGLFPPHALNATGYLDVSALFAILVYTLLVFFVGWVVDVMTWKLRSIQMQLNRPTA